MPSIRQLSCYAPFLLGIWACSVASAADGSVSAATSTHSAIGAIVTTDPASSSYPADAPARHRPPREAFDACKSRSEGAACSVTFDGHTMNGTCRKGPKGESELVCAPAHPPGPPPSASNQTLGGAQTRC